MGISGFRYSLISFLFLDLLAGAEFWSGENPPSDAVRSRHQMNLHHFHGGYPSRTSGVVERKIRRSDPAFTLSRCSGLSH
jgi:hypothetical protein